MFKRIIVILVLMVTLVSSSFAVNLQQSIQLISTNATGAGSATMLQHPFSIHGWVVTWSGTVPTSVLVNLEGSLDGTTWYIIKQLTVTTSGTADTESGYMANYVRANYVSKVGGDATTTVTVTYIGSGQ